MSGKEPLRTRLRAHGRLLTAGNYAKSVVLLPPAIIHESLHAFVPLVAGHEASVNIDMSEAEWYASTDDEWRERSPALWAVMAAFPFVVGLALLLNIRDLLTFVETVPAQLYIIFCVVQIVVSSTQDVADVVGYTLMCFGDEEPGKEASNRG
jgi:hypothetical protein